MTKRTSQQQIALDEIFDADQALRKAKHNATAEIKLEIETRIAVQKLDRDRLVRAGLALGLSKGVIGRMGLSTTDPAAVNKIISFGQYTPTPGEKPLVLAESDGPFGWLDVDAGIVRVSYPRYRGVVNEPDWDGSLRGTVQKTPSTRSGWTVLVDASDQKSEFGVIPGVLRACLDAGQEPLLTELNKWASA